LSTSESFTNDALSIEISIGNKQKKNFMDGEDDGYESSLVNG